MPNFIIILPKIINSSRTKRLLGNTIQLCGENKEKLETDDSVLICSYAKNCLHLPAAGSRSHKPVRKAWGWSSCLRVRISTGGSMWTDSLLLRDAGAAVLTGGAAMAVLLIWEQVGNRSLLDQVSLPLQNHSFLFLWGWWLFRFARSNFGGIDRISFCYCGASLTPFLKGLYSQLAVTLLPYQVLIWNRNLRNNDSAWERCLETGAKWSV